MHSQSAQLPITQCVRHRFDFTPHIRRVCDDMVARLPELAHIDMSRVAVAFCQARKPVPHGMFASLTPLRFAGGAATTVAPRPAVPHSARLRRRRPRDALHPAASICRGFRIWTSARS